jgi:hypothetical protein
MPRGHVDAERPLDVGLQLGRLRVPAEGLQSSADGFGLGEAGPAVFVAVAMLWSSVLSAGDVIGSLPRISPATRGRGPDHPSPRWAALPPVRTAGSRRLGSPGEASPFRPTVTTVPPVQPTWPPVAGVRLSAPWAGRPPFSNRHPHLARARGTGPRDLAHPDPVGPVTGEGACEGVSDFMADGVLNIGRVVQLDEVDGQFDAAGPPVTGKVAQAHLPHPPVERELPTP